MKDAIAYITDDVHHRLWLIYCQLKTAEIDSEQRLMLLEKSRYELGRILNAVNRMRRDTPVE